MSIPAGSGPVVRIVGTGLLGTSIALGLRAHGRHVQLQDASPTAMAVAQGIGGGVAAHTDPDTAPDIVVVAVPPDVTGHVVAQQLTDNPAACVTDVASVKAPILAHLQQAGADVSRYVGSHPMAGRERSGPANARADLFDGRPWVLCPAATTAPQHLEAVRSLATALSAYPVVMPAADHDRAVARTSHLPQVAASLVAASLADADPQALDLAGAGLRDMTRIADSDPMLWSQILTANAPLLVEPLRQLRDALDTLVEAADAVAHADEQPGEFGTASDAAVRTAFAHLIAAGNAGRERIPGKHGGAGVQYAIVAVMIPDEPGMLTKLFTDVGHTQVNIEELSLEHAPGRKVGIIELSVLPANKQRLEELLTEQGWRIVA